MDTKESWEHEGRGLRCYWSIEVFPNRPNRHHRFDPDRLLNFCENLDIRQCHRQDEESKMGLPMQASKPSPSSNSRHCFEHLYSHTRIPQSFQSRKYWC